MNRIVHLVLSDDTFGGFEHHVRITPEITSLDDLINSIVGKLRETLIYHKFENARVILQGKNFHIHGRVFSDIVNNSVNDTIYVCNH